MFSTNVCAKILIFSSLNFKMIRRREAKRHHIGEHLPEESKNQIAGIDSGCYLLFWSRDVVEAGKIGDCSWVLSG